jgi:Protein of unknown function (DUF3775)
MIENGLLANLFHRAKEPIHFSLVLIDEMMGWMELEMNTLYHSSEPLLPILTITPDSAFAILLKAREFDVKIPQTDPDSVSNPSDDNSVDALEFGPSDNTRHELISAIHDLNDDEQRDLIALILLGRGDFTLGEWNEARQTTGQIGRQHIPRHVAEIPLASDYLEEGLSQFNESLQDYLDKH